MSYQAKFEVWRGDSTGEGSLQHFDVDVEEGETSAAPEHQRHHDEH